MKNTSKQVHNNTWAVKVQGGKTGLNYTVRFSWYEDDDDYNGEEHCGEVFIDCDSIKHALFTTKNKPRAVVQDAVINITVVHQKHFISTHDEAIQHINAIIETL